MDFGSLKYYYEKYLSGEGEPVDNRQRINLSDYSVSVITNDMDIFYDSGRDLTGREQANSLSRYINRVIKNFREDSVASTAQLIAREESKYQKILGNALGNRECTRLLVKDYENTLAEKRDALIKLKGRSVNVRISKENMEYLLSPEAQANAPYYKNGRIGLFLKVLLEEYASKPFTERERIYFKDIFDTVHAAIRDRKLLKIILHRFKRTNEALTRPSVYLKPYAILEDAGKQYNYIVGYYSKDMKEPYAPYSVRLTSVLQCRKLGYSGVISGKEIHKLESQIEELGVQYAGSKKPERIIVELTEAGERLYRKILLQRPMYYQEEEKKLPARTHCFHCSAFQARVYFARFGKEARILAPEKLAAEFKAYFEEAAGRYRE